ncbi:hypothetical protein LCGC14_0870470 [marine sediment metagenome]|uniref:Uncharacterized protein n=1 Tax=marine sediment metagenome TaxID=412755 RepID=A0A0F9PQF0_9ZZZZ
MVDKTFFDNDKNKLYEEFPDVIIDINKKNKKE